MASVEQVAGSLTVLGVALVIAACGGSSASVGDGADGGVATDGASGGDDGSTVGDGGSSGGDSSSTQDTGSGGGTDGTPTRQACITPNGTAITTSFGRLDGYLVAIVPPGHHGCNGDSDHLHLQVKVNGAIYDVAVNMQSQQDPTNPDVFLLERDFAMGGGAWTEGWHSASDDYVQLGVHTGDFTQMPLAQLASKVEGDLATANHISVFCLGYGPSGCHDVHRRSGGTDGAIVMNPLSSTSRYFMFHFATQTF